MSTPTRFELARAEPIGFQNQLLNHSDTVSSVGGRLLPTATSVTMPTDTTKKINRQRRDLNSRGQSPADFESTSLTTRTRCLSQGKFRTLTDSERCRNQRVLLLVGDWSSGMIPALGAGGREFDSRITPPFVFFSFCCAPRQQLNKNRDN